MPNYEYPITTKFGYRQTLIKKFKNRMGRDWNKYASGAEVGTIAMMDRPDRGVTILTFEPALTDQEKAILDLIMADPDTAEFPGTEYNMSIPAIRYRMQDAEEYFKRNEADLLATQGFRVEVYYTKSDPDAAGVATDIIEFAFLVQLTIMPGNITTWKEVTVLSQQQKKAFTDMLDDLRTEQLNSVDMGWF